MKPLGSFLPALNALLQLRVLILDVGGYRYLARGIDTWTKYRYSKTLLESWRWFCIKQGIGTQRWVSVLTLGIYTLFEDRYSKTILESWRCLKSNRVSILNYGYRYSVLKSYSNSCVLQRVPILKV
ncbi:hypothetical protein GQ457_12G028450 [Hibiscus cannabinus]